MGIGIGVVVLVIGLLAFINTRPSSFRIERTADLRAPRDVVFGLIADFHEWARWSPFEKLDPNMKKTFEGPRAGPGARYAWAGSGRAGEGRMTIIESDPNERVAIDLDFQRPMPARNRAIFELVPSDSGTRVSWIMEGKNNFVAKAFSVFMNMDAMLGKEFEEGLANLERAAQAEAQLRAQI